MCLCVQELTGKYAHGKIAPCNYQLQVRLRGAVLALLQAITEMGEAVSGAGPSDIASLVSTRTATWLAVVPNWIMTLLLGMADRRMC